MKSIIERHSNQEKAFKQIFIIEDKPIYLKKFKPLFKESG